MCTVISLVRPGHAWPLLLAANRDERTDRAWDPPGAYWPGRPGLIAGRDQLGGGTWMALRGGVVAAVLNRPGSLGPEPGKRSRGALPLLALDHADPVAAVAGLDAAEYRTFNMVVAGRDGAWFVRGEGAGRPQAVRLLPGLHMTTAHDPDDLASPRVAAHLPRFRAAPPPDPACGDWQVWQALLADGSGARGAALCVPASDGFGTVCSSLVGVSAEGAAVWLFAAGPPGQAPFRPVALP